MENIDILNGELFIPMNENSKPNLDDILMKLNYLFFQIYISENG